MHVCHLRAVALPAALISGVLIAGCGGSEPSAPEPVALTAQDNEATRLSVEANKALEAQQKKDAAAGKR